MQAVSGSGSKHSYFGAPPRKQIRNKQAWKRIPGLDVRGYGGFIVRGDPSNVDLSNGLRWGVGVGVPSRKRLRFTGELHGERYLSDAVTMTTPVTAADGTQSPLTTALTSPVEVTFGLTWQGTKGVFAGAGLSWNLHMDGRDHFFGRFFDLKRRLFLLWRASRQLGPV